MCVCVNEAFFFVSIAIMVLLKIYEKKGCYGPQPSSLASLIIFFNQLITLVSDTLFGNACYDICIFAIFCLLNGVCKLHT